MKDAKVAACNLRMIECVLEAAPQLVLQIYVYILTSHTQHESWHIGKLSYNKVNVFYIILYPLLILLVISLEGPIKGRQVAAILSSFVGLAWSYVAFEKVIRLGFIFCFMKYEYHTKNYKVLVYYIITYLENFIMVGFWSYFTDAKGEWFYIPTFFVMPLGLVLWLFSGLMYFGYFHPSGERKIPFFSQMGINSCYQYLCHDS
ncbi:XK-related protein 6-like [Ruditapes philippinarum]|uniref:XK-related protein 6-like n=1 Tax=Ruditapes philippinarum TaxID=129788 RepID=UPI00295B71E1|nr:XK-related protein 6-like [Ruditapes philippinarum]